MLGVIPCLCFPNQWRLFGLYPRLIILSNGERLGRCCLRCQFCLDLGSAETVALRKCLVIIKLTLTDLTCDDLRFFIGIVTVAPIVLSVKLFDLFTVEIDAEENLVAFQNDLARHSLDLTHLSETVSTSYHSPWTDSP